MIWEMSDDIRNECCSYAEERSGTFFNLAGISLRQNPAYPLTPHRARLGTHMGTHMGTHIAHDLAHTWAHTSHTTWHTHGHTHMKKNGLVYVYIWYNMDYIPFCIGLDIILAPPFDVTWLCTRSSCCLDRRGLRHDCARLHRTAHSI
jgi:hypothetical protein